LCNFLGSNIGNTNGDASGGTGKAENVKTAGTDELPEDK